MKRAGLARRPNQAAARHLPLGGPAGGTTLGEERRGPLPATSLRDSSVGFPVPDTINFLPLTKAHYFGI